MPHAPINGVLNFLRRATLLQHTPDGELLTRYVAVRDQPAFEAILQRHGPMVLGVCRRLLPGPQDAEDAFQAAFLVLVRKAASVRPPDRLAAWLHGVARNAALKARKAANRRRVWEKQMQAMPEPASVAEGLWQDVLPLLDLEVSRLPEKYRVPVVLCDLEGKTRGEAARQLGWPEGTVAGRLARARAMLAKRLNRRGLPVSGGVLGAVLSQNPASASVPLALILSTANAASGAAAVPASVAALIRGVLKAMLLTKLKFAAGALLAVAVLYGGAVLLAQPFVRVTPGIRSLTLAPGDAVSRAEPEVESAPVTTQFIRKRGGKPPARAFDVKLLMRNPRDHPVWLLTGYHADEALADKGVFQSNFDQPFGGDEYAGAAKEGKGKAVEIHFLGKPSFRAFYLPAKATIAIEDYPIESWSDVTGVEFWEASSVLVNGRTPLEKWLPYPTLNDENVVVPAKTTGKNLDWDAVRLRSRTDYPEEAVKTVKAVVEKKWAVPITGIAAGDDK